MLKLSRKKFYLKVQSLRTSVIRARVQLCRKLITDIKKLSKKGVRDLPKNEKTSRKIERLKDEVRCLRNLKPDVISVFALSHSIKSCELLRNKPDIETRTRALTKLSLHKLVKPKVEEFQNWEYPNWEELLPNLLNGDVNKNDPKNSGKQNVRETVNTSNDENEIPDSDEEDEEQDSVIESMSTSSYSSEEHNNRNNINNDSLKKNRIKYNDLERNISNKEKNTALLSSSVKTITEEDKSKIKTNLKMVEAVVPSKGKNESTYKNKWIKESIDLPMDDGTYSKDSKEDVEMNSSHDEDSADNKEEEEEEEEEEEHSLEEINKECDDFKTADVVLEDLECNNNSNKTESESSSISFDNNKQLLCVSDGEKIDESTVEIDESLPEESEGSFNIEISQPKQKKISQDIKPITKQELNEDPFFLTKDDQTYMTYGKIVKESTELPSNESKRLDYEPKKSFKSWNEKSYFNKTSGNDKKWKDLGPGKGKSFPEREIVLHPSWEAKRRDSKILPFQGKKISFDD